MAINNFEVVISGISGRFPECDDIDTFKKKLYNGNSKDFITNDQRKWKNGFKFYRFHDKRPIPQASGKFIKENDVDFRAFKLNQRTAKDTDVLNRKTWEESFEAIVDAGINPASLSGANIGVFVTDGITEQENFYSTLNRAGSVYVLGCARTMSPNRLSYAFNLNGPSYASIGDPFGSMELLRLAKKMIQDGSIEGALVVAASVITHPNSSYIFDNLNMLTSEEFCCPFDENASGYVRSDGSVALFLQRKQDAKRIYAKFNFCDTLYEGLLRHTLLGYDEEYLRNSILKIYERNGGDAIAKDLAFLELSGTAVKKFDTIEANAVADVLFRWRKNPLLVGSIKSLVGHTEASSPLLSILKVIFALDSNIISPNTHISKPDESIRVFTEKKLQVVIKNTNLSGDMAAVNTTGLFGGVNHVVLERNFKESKDDTQGNDGLSRLILISGRTAEGLKKVSEKIKFDSLDINVTALTNDVFGTNIPIHTYRGFIIRSKDERIVETIEERGDEKRPVCFVFSGMGSQWNGMGKQLMNLPVFADAIKRCDAVLRPKSIDIYDVLLSDDQKLFGNITMSFVAIICMQIALVEVLKKLDINPDMMLGHSVGENGCAYADGCVTLEQAVLISYSRGIASTTTKLVKGMMAAIGKGYTEIEDSLPESIEVACHNSATSCTISGPAEDVETYVKKLEEQGIFARGVNVSNIAYHSRYIAPAGPELRKLLQSVIPNPKNRSSKWISSSIPEENWNTPLAETCSAEYLTNNLLNPVLFEEACKHIPKNAIVIEIAPHGLLQAILKRSLPNSCTNISLTRRSNNADNLNTLLSSIGRLYIAGCEPVVNNLYPLIEYPVPRGTPSISPYCTWFYGDSDIINPLYKPTNVRPIPLSRENIIVRINEDSEFSFLKYHQVHGEAVIPTSFFLYLVWRMLSVHKNVKMEDFPILFEKVVVRKNVKISTSKPRVINIMIQGSGSFEVLSRAKFNKQNSKVVLTGKINFILDEDEVSKENFALKEENFECTQEALNEYLRDAGFQLGECFQSLKNLDFKNDESTANIRWNGNWVSLLDAVLKFQMFSDIRKSKLCYLHTVRRIQLIPSVIKTLPHGSLIHCYHSKATKMFGCTGIQMNDVKWKIKPRKITEKSTSFPKIRKLRFVSYNNPMCQSFDELLDLCLQIATEDLKNTREVKASLNICDNTRQFVEFIQNISCMRNLTELKITYGDFKTLSSKKVSENDNFFVISEEIDNSIDNCNIRNLFVVLLKQYSSFEIPSGFSAILSQSVFGKTVCLLKKNPKITPEIQVEDNNAGQQIVSTEKETILCSKLYSSNMSLMLSRNKCSQRYLFVSNMQEPIKKYKPQLLSKAICNLPVCVLKNQDWGSYRYLPTNDIRSTDAISDENQWFNNIQIESINAENICREDIEIQHDDSSSNFERKLVGIGYSGTNSADEKIMGLTSACPSKPISKIDPMLTWVVPAEWKLTEAATVPVVYTHVYRVMKIIESSLHLPTPSVVINTDSKNVFAKSLIHLCLVKNLHCIYIVVPDENNATALQSEFPSLNRSNFIISVNGNFDHMVKLKTNGKGANVSVNFMPGSKNIISIMNCVSHLSQIIETVENNMNEDTEMGLHPFTNGCSFFVIPCRITHFLSLPCTEKLYLQKAIREGISSGLVKPVSQRSNNVIIGKIKECNIDNISTRWNSKIKLVSKTELKTSYRSMQFIANRSYIIIGGEHSGNACMKIIEWLRERDVSNFLVLIEKFSSNPRISSRVDNLLSNKNITISFKTLNQLNSLDDFVRVVAETNKLAPIDSVFFVSMESSSELINYMDSATEICTENVKFISLFAGGMEEMESRQSRGRPAFVLHGESFPKNLPQVLNEFEKILKTTEANDSQSILYEILEDSNISDGTSDQLSSDQLSSLKSALPKNIYKLEQIGRNISEEVKFVEMTSRCIRWLDCRGVYPIFVIPGLHAFELQSVFQSLMYPVFCATLTEYSSSVCEIASKLYEQLNTIQEIGPVTLIGETWNATIAMELSSMIKKSGRDFKLFILEGNPIEWKNTINNLNLTKLQEFENVLTKLYGDKILEHLHPCGHVEAEDKHRPIDKISNESQEIDSKHIRRSLKLLKRQFMNAQEYTFNNSAKENTIIFTKQVTHNIPLVLSISSEVIHINENNYDRFLRSPTIKKIINKRAMFAWL